MLAELKADPGPLGLDETVFAGVSDRIVAAWRSRAMRMYPSDFEAAPEPIWYTLLAALCWRRQAELRSTRALILWSSPISNSNRRSTLPSKATLQRRLLLVLFALGTNMGIRQMAATGEHGQRGRAADVRQT